MLTISRLTGAVLATALLVPGQTTWLVGGPSGLPQISDAIALAAPGDVLRIGAGTYAHFKDDKGLVLQAVIPGTVQVELDPAFIPPSCTGFCVLAQSTVLSPPPGQATHVVGIDFVGNVAQVGIFPVSHRVATFGQVTMDDCAAAAWSFPAVDNFGTLHLQDCYLSVTGSGSSQAALRIVTGSATVVDSEFHGSDTVGVTPASPGILMLDGTRLHGSGIYATGGDQAGGSGQPALRAGSSGTVWLADSVLAAGSGSCAVISSGATVVTDRTNILQTISCSAPPTDDLVGIERSSPLVGNGTFQLTVRTLPGAAVGVVVAGALGPGSALPGVLSQPMWLLLPQAQVAATLVADANGNAAASWSLPAVAVGQTLWLQAVAGVSLPISASPVVGGVVR